MWVLGNIQRTIREPHCANLMHSDLVDGVLACWLRQLLIATLPLPLHLAYSIPLSRKIHICADISMCLMSASLQRKPT
jgi:hypothetical protein